MDKRVDYTIIDKKWQHLWESSECYSSVPNEKPPISIIVPPPNCTGRLHCGHALNNMFIDAWARYKRMKGFNVCIVPGTDHAGLATQMKVEKHLASLNIDKSKMTRSEFIDECMKWKDEYGGFIVDQLKKLGCSYDWKRLKFTLDEAHNKKVREMFVKLYKDGLIYKGQYMTNWCTGLQTAISDEETVSKSIKGKMYYIKYKVKDSDKYMIIATSRPETLFGDSAVAFNPSDERYKDSKDIKLIIPIVNREIPLIPDGFVKKDFGSGLVKITPAHNKDDYEVGQRHNLPILRIIDYSGKIVNTGTKYDGIDRDICRKILVKELTQLGLIEKIEEYDTSQTVCSRTNTVIEPMLTVQWFVKMKPLAELARKMVHDKEVEFLPERQIKNFDNWTNGIRDWCISRQIVWGHRIPIYYCNDCKKEYCSEIEITECTCTSKNIEQEKDVLDTWFSSWLLPYSDFADDELDYYFPTSVLITGEDILFFWVIRMMMASGYIKGKAPFKKILLHGLVRDEQRVKMAKTLGNVIDPLEIIEKFGTDPLRFTLAMICPKEGDLQISMKTFDIGKTFCTKFWNVVRFCIDNAENSKIDNSLLDDADKAVLNKLNDTIIKIDTCMDALDYNHSGHALYSFVWDDFANTYLESTKGSMNDNKKRVLFKILESTTRLLSPFIPHLCEEIWEILIKKFNHSNKMVSLESYPLIYSLI